VNLPIGAAEIVAAEIVTALELGPHPEGGHFREVWRDVPSDGSRGAGSSIYFLLAAGEVSAWHRVDANEIWHFHAGAPLELSISTDGETVTTHRLGHDLATGERPQVVVPPGSWQSARSLGAWTLVGCTVMPAFVASGFELAPLGWEPGGSTRRSVERA
jgi:hypothetical protein